MAKKPKKDGKPSSYHREEIPVETLEDFIAISEANSNSPTKEWLHETFKSKSAIIRYLDQEIGWDVKTIAGYMGFEYRHVYSVVAKSKLPHNGNVCPVCMNRKG